MSRNDCAAAERRVIVVAWMRMRRKEDQRRASKKGQGTAPVFVSVPHRRSTTTMSDAPSSSRRVRTQSRHSRSLWTQPNRCLLCEHILHPPRAVLTPRLMCRSRGSEETVRWRLSLWRMCSAAGRLLLPPSSRRTHLLDNNRPQRDTEARRIAVPRAGRSWSGGAERAPVRFGQSAETGLGERDYSEGR
jgi:hypothetical protein